MWIEKHKDCWFNSDNETSSAVVTRHFDGSWFVLNHLGGEIGEFQTAQEAMYFVDENPDLFPCKSG